MRRYFFPDFLRGLAVAGMIVFHFFYIIDFLGWVHLSLYHGWWLVLARTVQFLFLGLVGFSMAMSYRLRLEGFYKRQLPRLAKIGAGALLVSLCTFLILPDIYVRQGVLHFIFLSSLVILPFVGRPGWLLAIAVVGVVGGEVVDKFDFSFPFISYILGFENASVSTVDYFPLLPWVAAVAGGAFLGNISFNHLDKIECFFAKIRGLFGGRVAARTLQFMGRWALVIYLTHVPLIILLLLIYWGGKGVLMF